MNNNDSSSQRKMPVDLSLSMGLVLYVEHNSGQEEINSNNYELNKPFVSENKYRDQIEIQCIFTNWLKGVPSPNDVIKKNINMSKGRAQTK